MEVTFCETFSGRAPGSAKDLSRAEGPGQRRFYEEGKDDSGLLGQLCRSWSVCHGGWRLPAVPMLEILRR
jgi:hypothetical protein